MAGRYSRMRCKSSQPVTQFQHHQHIATVKNVIQEDALVGDMQDTRFAMQSLSPAL